MSIRVMSASVLLAVGASSALADFVPVSLSPNVNFDIRSYTNGVNYPVGGSTLDFGGVPFDIAVLDGDPDTFGVTQLPIFTGPASFSFRVNIPGAVRLFTLINSAFGSFDSNNGTVAVFGTGGAFASFDLIQGTNIRDHFNGLFVNTLSDATVLSTNYPGDVRLDRQVLELPAVFLGETITELRFSGEATGAGVAFLAGATIETIPTPGATVLLGVAGLMAARRRR